jgi:hypothetical protein
MVLIRKSMSEMLRKLCRQQGRAQTIYPVKNPNCDFVNRQRIVAVPMADRMDRIKTFDHIDGAFAEPRTKRLSQVIDEARPALVVGPIVAARGHKQKKASQRRKPLGREAIQH